MSIKGGDLFKRNYIQNKKVKKYRGIERGCAYEKVRFAKIYDWVAIISGKSQII